jgi:hypothetical protein
MEEEIWKDIPGYEGLYQVSSLGQVKSLPKEWKLDGRTICHKEKILKPQLKRGYNTCALYKDKKQKWFSISVLVAMAFLNHKPNGHTLVVDHINNIRTDNRLINLQIITQRENVSRRDSSGYTSKYPGVFRSLVWSSRINIEQKTYHLGSYKTEERASEVYQLALKNIDLFDGDIKKFKALIFSL